MSSTNKPLPKRKKVSPKAVLAIDFDGVICDPITKLPTENAIDSLDILANRGFRIIVFSARATNAEGFQWVEDWLERYAVRYYQLTGTKPMADLYIDDKGLHHTGWDSTLTQISQRLGLQINIV